MANPHLQDSKPDGKLFDDYFDSIGKKAENLSEPKITDTQTNNPQDDEPRVVDEIESLCMNCHENVCVMPPVQESC